MQQAVPDWLDHRLCGRDPSTVETQRNLALRHVTPTLDRRKLRELSAEDVDRWLAEKAMTPRTSTVARIKSILARSITRVQALLDAAPARTTGAYMVVSLLTGARTEELRALTWSHVDLVGDPDATPPVSPHTRVWRSVRAEATRSSSTASCRRGRTEECPSSRSPTSSATPRARRSPRPSTASSSDLSSRRMRRH